MPIQQPPRQVTVNDIINSDERVVALKKTYHEFANKKNALILAISRVEADIIKTMGAFEYLNNFTDILEAQTELLPKFRGYVQQKQALIEEIKTQDIGMENATKQFQVLQGEIIKELQAQFSGPGTASCPESCESCPDDTCACGECHGECKGHNDQSPS
jgi:hypothetical protein